MKQNQEPKNQKIAQKNPSSRMSRRTFIKGIGGTLELPLLEANLDSLAALPGQLLGALADATKLGRIPMIWLRLRGGASLSNSSSTTTRLCCHVTLNAAKRSEESLESLIANRVLRDSSLPLVAQNDIAVRISLY